mmetsp:Transcript_18903/g.44111  ORF Transcript_18903/g.44111 Transcript_18903/m.44111 type:complete len:333 (+) Transcript_18903:984-1982(+)
MHCLSERGGKFLGRFPSCCAKAATSIQKHDHVNLAVTFHIGMLYCQLKQGLARHCIARRILETLCIILFKALAFTIGFLCNSTEAFLESTVAHLVAIAPLRPFTESAIPVTAVHVAILRLSQLSTWLAFEGRVHINGALFLADTTTARGTARTPATPIIQLAINGARVNVAGFFHSEWWACCTVAWGHQHPALLQKNAASTCLRAWLLVPLRHLTINDVGHVDHVITLHLLQLHADLLQATDLHGVCVDVRGADSWCLTLLRVHLALQPTLQHLAATKLLFVFCLRGVEPDLEQSQLLACALDDALRVGQGSRLLNLAVLEVIQLRFHVRLD